MTYVSQFGWPGDGGIGERLIQQILQGKKTATCGPVIGYAAPEIAEMMAAVGTVVDVTDKDGVVRATIMLKAVYETTFGTPTATLLAGEGYPDDPIGFQEAHRRAWDDWLNELGVVLDGETALIVEEFELVGGRTGKSVA